MNLQEYTEKYGGTYRNAYADAIARVRGELGSIAVSYDYEKDPLYAIYRRQYGGEGRYAALDAYGSAASNAGGHNSSYAEAAAEQARSYYDSKLADKIPELWKLAYDRKLSELESVEESEKQDYERWLDGLEWGYKLWNQEHAQAVQEENLRLRREAAARSAAAAEEKSAAAAQKSEPSKPNPAAEPEKKTYIELIKPKKVRGLSL